MPEKDKDYLAWEEAGPGTLTARLRYFQVSIFDGQQTNSSKYAENPAQRFMVCGATQEAEWYPELSEAMVNGEKMLKTIVLNRVSKMREDADELEQEILKVCPE